MVLSGVCVALQMGSGPRYSGSERRSGWPVHVGALAAALLLLCVFSYAQTGGAPTPPAPAPPAQAQTADKNAPEIATRDIPTTFTARVNLVLVRVVVRDSQGRAVGTLRQEDFQLFDRDKPQTISKFAVEKTDKPATSQAPALPAEPAAEMPAASPVPDRFVIYLFDDLHIGLSDLVQVREAALRHLAESPQSSYRAAIHTTSAQTVLDFTDDRDKLRDALLRIMPQSKGPILGVDCPYLSYYVADLILNRHNDEATQAAILDAQACGVDQQAAAAAVNLAALRTVSVGELQSHSVFDALKNAVRRLSTMPGQRGIILVSSGFLVPGFQRQDEGELVNSALRSNVTTSALDARGLYTPPGLSDASQRYIADQGVLRLRYMQAAASTESVVLAELADNTGGTLFHNDNNLEAGFRRLVTPPESYYVLAFSPQNLKLDGSYHPLKVTLKNAAGLSLQARRGYYAPRHELDPAVEAKREIEEAVFSRDEIEDIPVDVHTQFFKSSDVKARLSVIARVDIKTLRFRKAEERNNDTLTIVSGVFDRNGNWVAGIEKIIDMRLRDATLASLVSSGITAKSNFDLAPGSYLVRVVVRDAEGQLMAARNGAVEIP